MDEFIPAGGTAVAYKWLTDMEGPDGPELWHALDENLRLCFAQGWLMETDQDELETRDKTSDALVKGEHKLFYKMLHHLTSTVHEGSGAARDRWAEVPSDYGILSLFKSSKSQSGRHFVDASYFVVSRVVSFR